MIPDLNTFPQTTTPERFILDCRGKLLDCSPGLAKGAHVMGILNATPDSFSDGGRYMTPDHASRRVEAMLAEGAALIDIGGASTRPRGAVYGSGADPVSEHEEKARVLPVIKAVVARFPEAILSIDTFQPGVAREALEAGVHMVNDVTGLRQGTELATLAAAYGAPIVVMHATGIPGEMPHEHPYGDVIEEVSASLEQSVRLAEQAGVKHIVTDPGFGFGKSAPDNLRLLNHVHTLLLLGRPVLVGISRKSTIGATLRTRDAPAPVAERLYGTLGATAVAVLRGATLVRTHDVKPTVEMLRVLGAATAQSASSDAIL